MRNKLFALSVQTTLRETHRFSVRQTESIINAASPSRAVKAVEWTETLLESHPPGILGLVLSTALCSVDIHKCNVRGSLKWLYGISLPPQAVTRADTKAYLSGAVQTLVAKAQRGDFGQNTADIFSTTPVSYVYNPYTDTLDSTLDGAEGSLRHRNGGDE